MINDGKRYRSLVTSTPPASEPVSLSEAKAQCRVDIDSDDTYISALIVAAREYVEAYIDETLLPTQYVMRLDAFPATVELPRPPMVRTGTATAVIVTYTANDAGSTATLSTAEYRVDRDSVPGTLRPLYGGSWPSHLLDYGSVSVTWWAGRADTASVSQRVKAAILMLVAQWYERRMAADATAASEMPFGVKALLDSVKWGSYT